MSLPGPPPLNDSSGNHALIVAIETYRTKRDHSLDGPAHDAIGWLRWFREDCRVPSGNLLVLTSPLECNKGLFADLGVECRLDPDLGNEAVKDALRRFQGKAGRLWLIWSGHGIVRERERFAFLANYREDDRNVLSIETLQDHLKTTALRTPGTRCWCSTRAAPSSTSTSSSRRWRTRCLGRVRSTNHAVSS